MLTQMIYGPGFNKMIRGRYGYIIYNKNDKYVGMAVERYGEYQENEVRLFRDICKPGFHAADVGANIGTHSLALAKIVGQKGYVYSFEPQRIVYQNLCANMAVNSIENVSCYQWIVSDVCGTGLMPIADYNQIDNYGGVMAGDIGNNGYKVPKMKLDSLNLERLDFLKIDVEGMEIEAIMGAKDTIKKLNPVLYVENDQIDNSRVLIECIQSFGYKLYWHLPYLYNMGNYAEDPMDIYPGIVSVNMLCVNGHDVPLSNPAKVEDVNWHPFK